MNLFSCDHCATVLDADKLDFPDQKLWFHEDGTVNTDLAGWCFNRYTAKIPCPVCKSEIFESRINA